MSLKVTKSRRLTVRVGNYESMEIYAAIEQTEPADIDYIDKKLDLLMAKDVEDAHFQTAYADSFIHQHHNDLQERITK